MEISKGFSFDDVLLIPHVSRLESRSEVNIRSIVGGISLDLPIISAPMDTVTEDSMGLFMWESGGLGVIHRYCDINRQFAMVKWVKEMGGRVGAAIGVNGDSKERADALVEAGVDILTLDIAHGHSEKALAFCDELSKQHSHTSLMSPNIVTALAAEQFIDSGVDVLRVGVGPGSACTTRSVAGVGVPQLTAIENVREKVESRYNLDSKKITIVSDGGIKKSGDVVKALAIGADAVMVGGILAPFSVAAGSTFSVLMEDKTPLTKIFGTYEKKQGAEVLGLFESKERSIPRYVPMKRFRGMASSEALSGRKDRFVVEGESFMVPVRNDHREFIAQFRDGIQQGFSYLGAKNVKELRQNAKWIEVSPYGYLEGTPHFERG